ncbi:MAG: DNA-3-methyladenine glycosylase [Candidatus Izimaplasma bacterium HR2]|nr:MAG: DNA-3-methyladenine glycosylase [Candidatus Izimaplasma bacterium HR2]
MNDIIFKKFEITDEQKNYLSSKDELFKKLINVVGDIENHYIPDYFTALVNSIIYQAISFKAATTIWNRFNDLVGSVRYERILSISDEELRVCGLSKSKTSYIKNIANAFKNNEIRLDFDSMSNEEVIKELIKIKGIGNWTAQMFLTFSLFRKDIISYSDLAIRRGIEWLYEMDHELTIKEFNEFEKKFSPYNTIASLYLWEITLRKLFDIESINKV